MTVIEEQYDWANGLTKRTGTTNYIVLHHAEASKCTAQDIHRWHLANGWAGIGYHYFVRKDGSVYRGRPYNTIGAHCQGFNSNSVGICAEGKYETEIMPEAQKNAIIELCRELLTMYPGAKIVGHGDLNATSCPGANYPLTEIQERSFATVTQAQTEKVTIKIGDKVFEGQKEIDGPSTGPVRDVAEALGATVAWDEATKTVTVTPPDQYKLYDENQRMRQVIKNAYTNLSTFAI